MPRKSIIALTLLFCLSCFLTLRAEEADAKKQNRFPAVQKPVAEVVDVDLQLAPGAKAVKFENGKCVVVTGVVPWRDGLQIIDFELQRQEFPNKPADPEAGRWETVDIADSVAVLQNAAETQADLLPKELSNNVMTEPLPSLKTGDWPDAVVHPVLRKSLNDPPANTLQFRYLDFDVKPKQFYRYRVRLEFIKSDKPIPNASKQAITGDWSTPTKLKRIEAVAKK